MEKQSKGNVEKEFEGERLKIRTFCSLFQMKAPASRQHPANVSLKWDKVHKMLDQVLPFNIEEIIKRLKEKVIRILNNMALWNGSLRRMVCGFTLYDTLAHIHKTIALSIVTCNSKVSCFGFVFYISGFYVCACTDGNSFITCYSGLLDCPF